MLLLMGPRTSSRLSVCTRVRSGKHISSLQHSILCVVWRAGPVRLGEMIDNGIFKAIEGLRVSRCASRELWCIAAPPD